MYEKLFIENFNFRSFLPLILFIFGIFILFLFLKNDFSYGIFVMILGFIIYIFNNIISNIYGPPSVFNEYLEDMSLFFIFGLTTVVFGFQFYLENSFIIVILSFYSLGILLNLARGWIIKTKNSIGWPLGLNGLFFPIFYYIYSFYLKEMGSSIFLFFYIIIGVLSLSSFNFLSSSVDVFNLENKNNNFEKNSLTNDYEIGELEQISKSEIEEVFLNSTNNK